MSFGNEMKDFISGFKTGSDVVSKVQDRKLYKEHLALQDEKLNGDKRGIAALDNQRASEISRRNKPAETPAVDGDEANRQGRKAGPVSFQGEDAGEGNFYMPGGDGARAPSNVRSIIDKYVPEQDRDFAYRMAHKESGFRPDAVSSTGATGLFQFTGGTWKGTTGEDPRRGGDSRMDPEANTKAFVKLTNQNREYLRDKLGREPTYGELAVAHQQGAGGAYSLLSGGSVDPKNLSVQAGNPKNAADIMAYYGYGKDGGGAAKGGGGQLASGSSAPALPVDDMPDYGYHRAPPPQQQAQQAQTPEGLRERSYEDRYKNGYAGVLAFEDGGMVDREEDYRSMGAIPAEQAPQGTPVDAPVPQARRDALGEDGGEPAHDNPISAGLKFIQSHFRLNGAEQGALPTDTGHQDGVQRLSKGEGAASAEDYKAASKLVDPKDELSPALRNIRLLDSTYRFYLQKGDHTKAASAVASLMQYTRMVAAEQGSLAEQAIKKGDLAGGVKHLTEGYAHVPDGKDVQADPKSGQYVVKDARTGEPVHQGKFTPQDLIAQALRLKDGSGYWDNVIEAAAGTKPMTAAQQAKTAAAEASQKRMGAFAGALYDGGGDDGEGEDPEAASAGGGQGAVPLPPARPAELGASPSTPGVTGAVNPELTGAPNASTAAVAPASPGAVDPNAAPASPQVAQTEPMQPGEREGNGSEVGNGPLPPGSEAAVAKELGRPAPQRPTLYGDPGPQPRMNARQIELMQSMTREEQLAARKMFFQEKVMPWKENAKRFEAERQKQANDEYNNQKADNRVAEQERLATQRMQQQEKLQTDRLEHSDKAAETRTQAQIAAEERRAKTQQQHEIRVEKLKNMKPVDFDPTDKDAVQGVEGAIKDAFVEATGGKLKADDVPGTYGKQTFRNMRDAAIDIMRYNRLPHDSAAAAITTLVSPDQQYEVVPIEDSVDDRVRINFKSGHPPLVVPRLTADKIDIARGQMIQQAEKRAAQEKKDGEDSASKRATLLRAGGKAVDAVKKPLDSVGQAIGDTVAGAIEGGRKIIRNETQAPTADDFDMALPKPKGALNIEPPAWNNPFRNPNQ